MRVKERILTIASGHPEFNAGGTEAAAHALFRAYAQADAVEASAFLACHNQTSGATGRLFPLRADEYLWEQTISDWFTMRPAHDASLFGQLTDLLRAFRPTVVHLHHYAHIGLDTIRLIRSIDPEIRIILTLHEFLAMCFNQGQMITTQTGSLCRREGLEACHRCFPERSREDFWLRKDWYLLHFAMVDAFVAPSEFLRQRYIAWGIAPERITVIENALAAGASAHRDEADRPRNRFGFFGQVTPYKGIDVLLAGLARVPRKQRQKMHLTINAANLERQSEAFQNKLRQLSEPLEAEGVVHWAGPYDAEMKAARFRGVDWVVVPSIWWENSPVVIQEAFANQRPVLCSDIGGMAEKVTDGVDGRHVPVRNPAAWSEIFLELSGNSEAWLKLRSGIAAPPAPDICAAGHLALVARARNKSPGDG